jgi:hypothetical protein
VALAAAQGGGVSGIPNALRRWSIRFALAYPRHCERSEAIHLSVRVVTMDCFASLAMTLNY